MDAQLSERPSALVSGVATGATPQARRHRQAVLRALSVSNCLLDLAAIAGAAQIAGSSSFLQTAALALIVLAGLFLQGLYEPTAESDSSEYGQVFAAANLALPVDLILNRIAGWPNFSVDGFITLWLCVNGLLFCSRLLVRRVRFALLHQTSLRKRVLVVGVSDEASAIVRHWSTVKSSNVEAVGYLDDQWAQGLLVDAHLPVLGRSAELEQAIQLHSIDSVLIARPELIHEQLESSDRIMRTLSEVEVLLTTGIADLFTSSAKVREEGFVPLAVLSKRRMGGLHLFAKTILDYVGTIVVLCFTAWIMPIIAILVKLESPGPIIYRHRCIGLNDKVFYMLKFRSMFIDGNTRLTDEQREELRVNMKLKDDPRVTKVGKFLRKTSLDELPQLFNVLLGHMSWVGPRPVVEREAEKFGRYRHIRSTVKPGLTGLWQVSGRSDLTYDERVKLEIDYVRNHTIWLDLEILIKTIPALLARRGAY
jgi:exopolysaccharide biosynthesis polyprenyl glycosylphosphotransferase